MCNDPAAGRVIKHSVRVVCQENLPRHTTTTDKVILEAHSSQ